MKPRLVALGASAYLVLACAAGRPVSHTRSAPPLLETTRRARPVPTATPVRSAAAERHDASWSLPAPSAPWMDDYFATGQALRDPKGWVFSAASAPAYRAAYAPSARQFPGQAFTTAVAYRYGFDAPKYESLLGKAVLGCEVASPIANDGTLCPAVLLPGIPVPRAVADELVSIVNAPEPIDRVTMCLTHLDFAVLLLDAEGRIVGQLQLSSDDCSALLPRPWAGGLSSYLGPERRERVRAVMKQLQVGAALSRAQEAELRHQQQLDDESDARTHAELASFRARFLPSDAGVSPTLSFEELTTADWRALCAEHAIAWRRTNTFGLEDPADGSRVYYQSFEQCVAHHPTHCSASVGEVLACSHLRLRGDPTFNEPLHAHCRALRDCSWGFSATNPEAEAPRAR